MFDKRYQQVDRTFFTVKKIFDSCIDTYVEAAS